jgi:UDP-GlcNAc3NAcA epimerase
MKRILTIIGARPQFIKAAAVSRAIRRKHRQTLEERLLHTGQHYDERMSEVFFNELEIPPPDYRLSAGGGTHATQTAAMLTGIESVLTKEHFDGVLLYGDTNSTLAGALAAVKMQVPVIHVEAGLRSFNKRMPEEVNRITCDHCATLLFSPTLSGMANLAAEGFDIKAEAPHSVDKPGIFHCGDVMYDNALYFAEIATQNLTLGRVRENEAFALVTLHRPYNTDDPDRLTELFNDVARFAAINRLKLVIPLHPRTREKLLTASPELLEQLEQDPNTVITQPASFLEMIWLEKHARLIITDSGGVQKEAFFFRKPCVVVRSETEWVEIVEAGCALLAFETGNSMQVTFEKALRLRPKEYPPIFGDGHAAEFICQTIVDLL